MSVHSTVTTLADMSPLLLAAPVVIPVALGAALMMLAELAPDTFDWIERAIARIPGLQRTWDYLYSRVEHHVASRR